MSGIYIHIPFCKQKCTYCDFYTVVAPGLIDKTIDSLIREIDIRKDYLSDTNIQTIYFGGGTPSILTPQHFSRIFSALYSVYSITNETEITFEANPDDLSDNFFDGIRNLPFNRISIGIQSFNDNDLKRVNRRHTAVQALEAVKRAQNYGFSNISIDLIYGLPDQSIEEWKFNVEQALNLNIQHISAYGLTFEQGTVLWKQLKKGQVQITEDERMNKMFELLRKMIEEAGFEAYEISNFSLPGFRSKHNSAYWKMIPYIGLGPSAHSFNSTERQWNVSSIKEYNTAIEENRTFWEKEILTSTDRLNDYIMVSLRTSEGLNMSYIQTEFGQDYWNHIKKESAKYIASGHIFTNNHYYTLTTKGIEISNTIISDLMVV